MCVRLATTNDLARLEELYILLQRARGGEHVADGWTKDDYDNLWTDIEDRVRRSQVWVHEFDCCINGLVDVTPSENELVFVVALANRRQGIGREMVRHIKSLYATLTANPVSAESQTLLKSENFVDTGSVPTRWECNLN